MQSKTTNIDKSHVLQLYSGCFRLLLARYDVIGRSQRKRAERHQDTTESLDIEWSLLNQIEAGKRLNDEDNGRPEEENKSLINCSKRDAVCLLKG